MSRIANRLLGIVQWARVVGSRAATGKIGRIWTKGPPEDELQHWQQYGFLSRPKAGADAIDCGRTHTRSVTMEMRVPRPPYSTTTRDALRRIATSGRERASAPVQ